MANKQVILRDAGTLEAFPGGGTEKFFPHLHFTIEQLPEIGLWVPGETYTLVIKVKEKEHKIEKSDGKVEESASFEVMEVGALNSDHQEVEEKVNSKLRLK